MSEAAFDNKKQEHLCEHIAEELRAGILTGKHAEGERISEQQAAQMFGVSRTPVREAFRILHAEGALLLQPNRGAVVPRYDRLFLQNTIEVMEYLEAAAGELSCRRISDERVDWIAFLTQQMKSAFGKGERLRYYALNRQIHEEIARAAGNNALLGDYRKYNARLYRTRFLPVDSRVNWKSAMREHLEMVKFLRARDGEQLSALLRGHLSHAWRKAGINPVTGSFDGNIRKEKS